MKLLTIAINILLVLISMSCRQENKHDLIIINLDSTYIDTASKNGSFRSIQTLSTKIDRKTGYITEIMGVLKFQYPEKQDYGGLKTHVFVKNRGIYLKIDTNADSSFVDEQAYKVDSESPLILIENIEISTADKNQRMKVYVKPMLNAMFPAKHPLDISLVGVALIFLKKTNKRNDFFRIDATNMYETTYTDTNTVFFINDAIGKPNKIMYQINDTIQTNGQAFILKKIEKDGSKLYIEKIEKFDKLGSLEGDYALDIKGKDIVTDEEISLTKIEKEYKLLDFWGTWCYPCTQLTDTLKLMHNKYFMDLKIIGIATDDSESVVKNYLTNKKVFYSNIYQKTNASTICNSYNVKAFPTFILLDNNNKIIVRGTGKETLEKIRLLLKRNLGY